jgi:hypothetical protein
VTSLSRGAFAQAWPAAVGRAQTWAWWASGIALVAAILTLFAPFEKRRNGVLRGFSTPPGVGGEAAP